MRIHVISFLGLPIFLSLVSCKDEVSVLPEPLPAHSHNDYNHEHPLTDALDMGFRSIEADVFSIGDSLFVAHDAEDIQPGRTLRSMYLNPIKERVQMNGGYLFADSTDLILLVDIKSNGLQTYIILDQILQDYCEMLTVFQRDVVKKSAVSVIISGNRPLEYMKSQIIRLAGFDGRISDMDGANTQTFMPLVSDNWRNYFSWDGAGEMPAEEQQFLNNLVDHAKRNGCMLRFWATPDQPGEARTAVWRVLTSAGIDLIGSDDLQGLEEYLKLTKK